MNKIIKDTIAVIGILSLLAITAYIIFAAISLYAFKDGIFDIFEKEVISEHWDEEKLHKVTLVKDLGNAVTSPSLHVIINTFNKDEKLDNKKELFIVDASYIKDSDIGLKWLSNDALSIEYECFLRIFKQEYQVVYPDSTLNFKILYTEKSSY